MNAHDSVPELAGLRRAALAAAAAGALVTVAGAFVDPTQFFRSYLMAWVYWAGVALGCLGLLMVYHLTGGGWGVAIRRLLEAAIGTLPAAAVLFVPLLFGLGAIYVWTDRAAVLADHVLSQKAAYLNVPFFIARTAIYFLVWLALAHFLDRWSRRQEETADPRPGERMKRLSGGGLVIYGLAMTFAAFDWIMSLDPHWYSTIFGMIFIADSALGALAFVLVISYLLARGGAFGRVLAPSILNDLGNLLLAFVMVYAYVSFSQLLIIWSANLPEEITWYLRRIEGGWHLLAIALAVFYFAVPFMVLLSRGNKRQPQRLALIAGGVLAARLLSVFFLIAPAFHEHGLAAHWLDAAALVGLGGTWLALFVWRLSSRPLLAHGDPELAPALARRH
ncbi:MAG TPA: hypothetical protein PKK95_00635 [Vicinamibacterales bacterium]|nr:hypothetical protein [Vicinamibacterales bacterium]